jgi:hypothetical protein
MPRRIRTVVFVFVRQYVHVNRQHEMKREIVVDGYTACV